MLVLSVPKFTANLFCQIRFFPRVGSGSVFSQGLNPDSGFARRSDPDPKNTHPDPHPWFEGTALRQELRVRISKKVGIRSGLNIQIKIFLKLNVFQYVLTTVLIKY